VPSRSGVMDIVAFKTTARCGPLRSKARDPARSAAWIAAEYSNQFSPVTFFGTSAEMRLGGPNSPVISSLSSTSGSPGQAIVMTGNNFGGTQGDSAVRFNGGLRHGDRLGVRKHYGARTCHSHERLRGGNSRRRGHESGELLGDPPTEHYRSLPRLGACGPIGDDSNGIRLRM
jgi:hypothetical protein